DEATTKFDFIADEFDDDADGLFDSFEKNWIGETKRGGNFVLLF
ncbi:unnamed protein product, partial [Rotaria sp. Silwood2]